MAVVLCLTISWSAVSLLLPLFSAEFALIFVVAVGVTVTITGESLFPYQRVTIFPQNSWLEFKHGTVGLRMSSVKTPPMGLVCMYMP
jgi:hypothetical protein